MQMGLGGSQEVEGSGMVFVGVTAAEQLGEEIDGLGFLLSRYVLRSEGGEVWGAGGAAEIAGGEGGEAIGAGDGCAGGEPGAAAGPAADVGWIKQVLAHAGDPFGEDERAGGLPPAFQGSQRADQEGHGVGDARRDIR